MHFSKGVNHDFCQKIQNFPILFLGQNEPRNMFHDVLDEKETILEQKNNNFLEGQNWQFCKGVNP